MPDRSGGPRLAIVLVLSAGAWSQQGAPPSGAAPARLEVRRIAAPEGGRAAEPCLARGADGRTYLSWIVRRPGGRHALRFSVLEDGGWSQARTIAEGRDWFVNWADVPSVTALEDGTLAAHWLERLGKGRYAYGIRVSCSRDRGRSWSPPFWLHRDRSPTEHGFATLVPLDGRRFAAVWLDGRRMARGGDMTLRSTVFDAAGRRGAEILVDDRVCECCSTAAVSIGGAVVAVYRDRSPQEIRDISVVRSEGGKGWSRPRICHADRWEIPG